MADATATQTDPDTGSNDVRIEDAGPARKRLTITIPADTIDERLETSLATLAAEANVRGFRKGRVPKALLERQFGKAMRDEAKSQLIADAYSSAIQEHSIRPVGEPEPVGDFAELELKEGTELQFAVEVEVVPQFDLPSLDGIEIKKPMVDVSDEHIEAEVERQQLQLGTGDEVEADFTAGDRLICRGVVTKNDEDEPFFTNDNVLVVYPGPDDDGKGQVLGVMVDDLEKHLKGASVGDEFTLKTTGPEGHEREDLRGAKLVMEMRVRSAHRITPAPIDVIVEQFGLGSEENFREQVKLALEQRRDQEQSAAMREQVHEYLLDNIDFELPQKLSEAQATRNLERQRLQLLSNGISPDEVETHLAKIRAESDEISRRRLKLMFLLARLSEEFKIEIGEQEINGAIATMAARQGERPSALRNQLAQAGRLPEIASQLREQKAADRVLATAKITEITAEQWNEIVDGKNAGAKKKTTTKKKSSASGSTKKTTKKTTKKKTSKKTSKK